MNMIFQEARYKQITTICTGYLALILLVIILLTTRLSEYRTTFMNEWNDFFYITDIEFETLLNKQTLRISPEGKRNSIVADLAINIFDNTEEISVADTAHAVKNTGDSTIQQRVAAYKVKLQTMPDPSVKSQMASRPGMIGRLTIPSLGVNVALFASNSQAVVDAADSAAYFGLGSCTIIGDHWNQGFNAIKSASAGTVAYIDDGNTKRKLVCTGLCRGTNTGFDMLDSNGNSISGRGGYAMYTCNSNWTDITIVFFS
mgnify:FL=1